MPSFVTPSKSVANLSLAVILSGGIFFAWPAAAGENSAPAETWTSLFDGKSLAGWSIPTDPPFDEPGKAEVRDGAIQLPQGNDSTGVRRDDFKRRTDYEIELEAQRVSGSDFFCGLTFPVGEEQCTWIVGGWGGTTVGLSNVDDMNADENETTQSIVFEKHRWYRLRLRVTDAKIQAWIDDKQVIDLERKDRRFTIWLTQEPMPPLGIANWNTSSAVRGIRVRDVSEPAPRTLEK